MCLANVLQPSALLGQRWPTSHNCGTLIPPPLTPPPPTPTPLPDPPQARAANAAATTPKALLSKLTIPALRRAAYTLFRGRRPQTATSAASSTSAADEAAAMRMERSSSGPGAGDLPRQASNEMRDIGGLSR